MKSKQKKAITNAGETELSASYTGIPGGAVRKLGVVIFAQKEEVSEPKEAANETANRSPLTGSSGLWFAKTLLKSMRMR